MSGKKRPEQARNRVHPKGHRTSTSWRPGESGNPAGRPPNGLTLAEVMRELLDQSVGKGPRTKKEKLADAVYTLAVSKKGGAMTAARLIFEVVGGADMVERFKAMERRLEMLEQRGGPRAVAG